MLRAEDVSVRQRKVQQQHDAGIYDPQQPAQLGVGRDEEIPPGARSPHPYRRQSLDIHDRIFVTNIAARERQQPFQSSSSSTAPHSWNKKPQKKDPELSDASSSQREGGRAGKWNLTTSPSDSGTEADDERLIYLRGLPPASAKSRKGLRGYSGATTPSDFESVKQKLLLDDANHLFERRRKTRAPNTVADEDEIEKRTRQYSWKWRGELLRRVLEHIFLCVLTHVCIEPDPNRLAEWPFVYSWRRVKTEPLEKAKWLVAATLLAYLIKAFWLWTKYLRAVWKVGSMTLDKIPSPGDPGSTLYPLLLPLAVASAGTMTSSKPAIVLLNLVLCPCTYTFVSAKTWLANLQWTAIIFATIPFRPSHSPGMPFYENLTLLLPLHDSLTATIQHYCGTSLLSAESQLLSIGLVNLFFFAESSQALILFALIWIGGFSILLGCRHVMTWSTILARIPGWRFRSPRHSKAPASTNQLPQTAIGALLRSSSFFTNFENRDSSDDGEVAHGGYESGRAIKPSPRNVPEMELGGDLGSDVLVPGRVLEALGGTSSQQSQIRTVPAILKTDVNSSARASTRSRARKRKTKHKPFLWLTRTQATVVKWLFAIYVYTFTIIIIISPIRRYVQERALGGREPFGWALSYLLGDLSYFRLHVILSDLDSWIPLPPRFQPAAQGDSIPLDLVPLVTPLRQSIGPSTKRLLLVAHCVASLSLGLFTVFRLRNRVEVDTRRKVFHGMMVAMFLPTILADPCFISLAFSLVLAIFLLLDLFRATQLPPISRPLTNFLAPYVDGRDHKGPVVVSPIFLLIGCAIPLWLSLASARRIGAGEGSGPGSNASPPSLQGEDPFAGWDVEARTLDMVAGVVCVGLGDAAASLVGRRFGRRRWIWSGGKSLEGSVAFVAAVSAGLLAANGCMAVGGWRGDWTSSGAVATIPQPWQTLAKTLAAGAGASFTEAVLTAGNDNVIVPVVLWLLVRCLGM